MTITHNNYLPDAIGLYDPKQEKDSCGVGFVAHIKGERSHQIILDSDIWPAAWTIAAPEVLKRTPVTAPGCLPHSHMNF